MLRKLRSLLENEERGLSAEFDEEELLEYLEMSKELLETYPNIDCNEENLLLRAAAFAAFALAASYMDAQDDMMVRRYTKMKNTFLRRMRKTNGHRSHRTAH